MDYLVDGDAGSLDLALADIIGGMSLGTIHDQKFFAIRAGSADLRFPFSPRPFTAMVDVPRKVDDSILESYATALISHGCVQAVCRGEESERLLEIFDSLAEKGDLDRNGFPFTTMGMDDEPLHEAIQYFVLPCDLAQTGLLVVIGDAGDFQNTIQGFSTAAGAIKEDIGEPVYTDADLVCFVSP